MSVSKHKRTSSRLSSKSKEKIQDTNIIYEHVRRIDGQEVVRKYLKCGLLGKGGFANCFISENMETKRKSATKIVMKDQLKSHRTRLRLANQIKLHKALHHPNVVELYHCFQDKENVYIFLELCENQSLNELIRVRTNFITPEIQSFMLGIVNGVNYIHSQKIIHRDLKLGNIFIDSKFNVKIGDFGLATKLEFKRECKRTVCGTPNYIAPEVLQGKGYHFQVDIWSIGVILYTFYYGIPPFETEDANSTYQKIKECDYFIPKSLNVPTEAISLIQKILVRNPADRPTLDEILASDFMRLGQGILRELPAVCSRKAPTKKELINTSTTPLPQPFTQKSDETSKQFVVSFQELLEDTYYFKMLSETSGIVQKDVRVLYAKQNGQYFLRSLTNNFEEDAGDCQLKYLLMGKQRRFNVLDNIKSKSNIEPVFIRKIQKINDGFILRLSNKHIQFLIEGSNYLFTNGNRLWEIVGRKQKEMNLSKLMSGGAIKGNQDHLRIIRHVIAEIQAKKEDYSKENRPS